MGQKMLSASKERILILGGSGLVGSAIRKRFHEGSLAQSNEVFAPSHAEVDLLDLSLVMNFVREVSPTLIIMAAGQVGGISFNASHQSEQYSSNLLMNYNLLKVGFDLRISKLLLISSSCLYPANLLPPFSEESVFLGLPESTNDGYAAAKLAAIRQLLIYRNNYELDWQVCIPTNVYGVGDVNFEMAHVIPQMIHKIIRAKIGKESKVEFYGDGTPIREFIFNSDLGDALYWIYSNEISESIINISTGHSISIRELAELIANICDFKGELTFNPNYPNGHPNKSLNSDILAKSGWRARVGLENGIALLVKDYVTKHSGGNH